MNILEQWERAQYWDLYCAIVANPLSEDISFEEFVNQCRGKGRATTGDSYGDEDTGTDVKRQVKKSNKILKGFVPVRKGEAKGGK